MSDERTTRDRLKTIVIEALNLQGMSPDEIGDDEPLFGDGLGLDSVDALELVVALEKEYQIKIEGQEATRDAFTSIATLAAFVERMRAGGTTTA